MIEPGILFGRVTGGTLYPGLMVTSGIIWHTLREWFSCQVDIRNICVLLAPAFSGLTAISTYFFTKEMKDSNAGLLAAIFMGIAPGYISRSVAGSYDNEAIAITLLMATFYFWIKAMKIGSGSYWYFNSFILLVQSVSAWGGYVFITNLIPLHIFVLILMGRYNHRLYTAYTTWYALGTLSIYANSFCRIFTNQIQRPYGSFRGFRLITTSCGWSLC